MGDLQNPKWMYLKGLLFLAILGISVFIIVLETRDLSFEEPMEFRYKSFD